jgi:hypothetical protein
MLRSRASGPRASGTWESRELSIALAIFWLLSVVEAITPLLRHEAYGAQASLATIVVGGVPYLLFDGLRSRRRARV